LTGNGGGVKVILRRTNQLKSLVRGNVAYKRTVQCLTFTARVSQRQFLGPIVHTRETV